MFVARWRTERQFSHHVDRACPLDRPATIITTTARTLARSTLRRAYRSTFVSSAGSGASECRRPWEKRRVKSAGRGADPGGRHVRGCGYRWVDGSARASSRDRLSSHVCRTSRHPRSRFAGAHNRSSFLPPPTTPTAAAAPVPAAIGFVVVPPPSQPMGPCQRATSIRLLGPSPSPFRSSPLLCPCERKDASSCAVRRAQSITVFLPL